MLTSFKVERVSKDIAVAMVLKKHYSHRAPICWEAFGLIANGLVEGVVIYGQPSPPIQRSAFIDRDFRLYELTRLVVQTTEPNAASFLVGRSLKMLTEQPSAVVSYADSEQGHAGIIYQATNWVYTGATKSHDHAYLVDGKRVHPMSLRERGITDPKRWAAENNIETIAPLPKHRYFYMNGTPRQRKTMLEKLKYPQCPYPKCDKSMYDDGPRMLIDPEIGVLPDWMK